MVTFFKGLPYKDIYVNNLQWKYTMRGICSKIYQKKSRWGWGIVRQRWTNSGKVLIIVEAGWWGTKGIIRFFSLLKYVFDNFHNKKLYLSREFQKARLTFLKKISSDWNNAYFPYCRIMFIIWSYSPNNQTRDWLSQERKSSCIISTKSPLFVLDLG